MGVAVLLLWLPCIFAFGLIRTEAGQARARNVESVHVHVKESISRAADGTITARVVYAAPDPRCFSGSWLKALGDGYYHVDGTYLEFAQYGRHANANPPGNGWLVPAKLGISPSIWEAVWPGSAKVAVQLAEGPVEDATVADATGVYLNIEIPRNSNHLNKYFENGEKVFVSCTGPEYDLRKHF